MYKYYIIMKLLSIDIGIKNLAYVIIESNSATDFKIIKWDVINLITKNNDCTEPMCKKKAVFFKDTNYYCKMHAKKTNFSIPLCNIKTLHKQSLKRLILLAHQYNIVFDKSITKPNLVLLLETYLNNECLQIVENVSANTINLVQLGINIKNELNEVFKDYDLESLDKIILENQISPIANRMKTIQGMIAQYFINSNNYNIFFISAVNKLKSFLNNNNNNKNNKNNNSDANIPTSKITYANRKKLSIYYTKEVLDKYNMTSWLTFFSSHSKKDDLADCFLQAYYYINL